jgi:basic membrane protein A and related proteins
LYKILRGGGGFMRKISLLIVIFMMILFIGCSSSSNKSDSKFNDNQQKQGTAKKPFKVGIVFDSGGLGDKSFNDATYSGIQRAEKELGIQYDYKELVKGSKFEKQYGITSLTYFAENNYDLIISVGLGLTDSCKQIASKFPNQKFVQLDDVVSLPNVTSVTFKDDEGSYLVGAVAGITTKTNKIGLVAGMDTLVFRKFKSGYEQGAAYSNPKVKIDSKVIGGDTPFNNTMQGYKLAMELINQGSDVVFAAAGASGIGVIQACKEKGVYAIGVDSDQDNFAKGTVLTSMMKRLDNAVYLCIDKALKNELKPGILEFGVAENGVGTTDFKYTRDLLPAGTLDKLELIKKKFLNKEINIKICDNFYDK